MNDNLEKTVEDLAKRLGRIERTNLADGPLGNAIMTIIYAFIILGFAVHKKDKIIAKSSFPVILFGFIYGISAHVFMLDTLSSIIGLAMMGSLIYICGYMYRKIPMN